MIIMDRSKQWETLVVILSGLIVLYWFKRHDGLLIAAARCQQHNSMTPGDRARSRVSRVPGPARVSLRLGNR